MMMNPAVGISDHDQLPSVESYKASVGYRTSESTSNNAKVFIPNVEPIDNDFQSNSTLVQDLDQSFNELPNVDEYKAANPPSRSYGEGGFWKLACIGVTLILLSLIAVITVPLARNDDTDWWLHYSDRYYAVERFLVRNRLSMLSDLQDESSPQHKAAKWIANKDGMRLAIPQPLLASSSLSFIERYVLAVFYYATNGPEWTHQLNFMTGEHVCTWYDTVAIDDDSSTVGADYVTLGIHACKLVDNELVPIALFLPDNNLAGQLPLEMKYLDRLEILNLPYNSGLAGSLPFGLDRMASLTHVGLSWCGFNSTIPDSISGLKNLTYLGLGSNQLTGPVPSGIATLENLQLLDLGNNTLSANIELFASLKNIKYVYLDNNHITGTLSDALFVAWPALCELDLSNNMLGGSLPDDFFNHFNSLNVVDLSKNDFSGGLPIVGWDREDLEFLGLNENRFSGTIPSEIVKLRGLTHLDLSGNNFGGVLPGEMRGMKKLEYLFVGNNAFESGVMPTFLTELTNLNELSLKNTRLVGSIPNFIGFLTKLKFLDLQYNELTGKIPSEIGELVKLEHLLLKSNKLSGALPLEMKSLSNLDLFIVDKNDIVGSADPICAMPNLSIRYFVSDCLDEIDCSCCTLCCADTDKTCNTGEWNGNIDWGNEHGGTRSSYTYFMGSHIMTFP